MTASALTPEVVARGNWAFDAFGVELGHSFVRRVSTESVPRNTLIPTYVTVPNTVTLGQTVWEYVVVPKFGDAGAPPPCYGACLTH